MKKPYDLEERTHQFARDTRKLTKQLKKTIENVEDIKQVVRSSGSVAANYIEANEALSPKDFLYRIKICRKEAKETRLWMRLLDTHQVDGLEKQRANLMRQQLAEAQRERMDSAEFYELLRQQITRRVMALKSG